MTFEPTPESCLTRAWLDQLVVRCRTFDAEEHAGEVFDQLQASEDDGFFGIVAGGAYIGLIWRAQLGILLSGRFGYSLYAKHPIREHLLEDSVVVRPGEPLLAVLDRALGRKGPAFHHDLAVVDDDGRFIGVLPMPTLLRLQNELIAEQARRTEEDRHILESFTFQLVISDIRLPGRNGLSLYEECRQRWPEVANRFLFITGDPGSQEISTALEATGRPVLRKPFGMDALSAQAAELLPKEREYHFPTQRPPKPLDRGGVAAASPVAVGVGGQMSPSD
jgi:CheY-like chemotaxis protein